MTPWIPVSIAAGILFAVCVFLLTRPRTGTWRCRRCTVLFKAVEGSPCPACEARSPHHWMG